MYSSCIICKINVLCIRNHYKEMIMRKTEKISLLTSAIAVILVIMCVSLGMAQNKKKAAPSFKTRDLKGKLVTSESLYSAGPSIVFFWHSCCGLNKDQLQTLKDFHSKY